MSARRRLIREAAKEILKGKTAAGDNVFTNLSTPIWREDLPQIVIYSRSEAIEDNGVAPKEYKRTVELAIEIVAEGPEDPNDIDGEKVEDILDAIAEQVEELLELNETFGEFVPDPDRPGNACAVVDELKLNNVEFEFSDGDKATGSCRLIYNAVYYEFRPKSNRDQIGGDFNTLFATWNIDGDEPEAEDQVYLNDTEPPVVVPPPVISQAFESDGGAGKGVAFGEIGLIDLNFHQDWSVLSWINTNEPGSNSKIFCQDGVSSSLRRRWSLQTISGQIRFVIFQPSGTAGKVYDTVATFDDGNWHQIAMTYASNDLKCYVDGTQLVAPGSLTLTTDLPVFLLNVANPPLFIGSFDFGTGLINNFSGKIDRASLWNKVLSPAEIAEEYNGGNPQPLATHSAFADVLEYWDFDGDTDPTATGKKAGNDGTVQGGATIEATGI